MIRLSILLIISISVGNVMAIENSFWSWFSSNVKTIESFSSGDEGMLNEILRNLHSYDENLYFEISTHEEVKELVITAEGDAAHFESVRRLISEAPDINNWIFVAFKPPMGFDFVSEYEGVTYDPSKLWFLPLVSESNPSLLGLRVGIPNYDEQFHEHSVPAILILLDTGLGELKAAEEINHVETGALPKNPASEGYIEFDEIGKYIDWRKNNT